MPGTITPAQAGRVPSPPPDPPLRLDWVAVLAGPSTLSKRVLSFCLARNNRLSIVFWERPVSAAISS